MTLLVAAFRRELESLYQQYASPGENSKKGVVRGEICQQPVLIAACGMGPGAAAQAVQKLVDHSPISQIIFLGLAGSLQQEVALNDLVIPQQCRLSPLYTTQEAIPCTARLYTLLQESARRLFPQQRIHTSSIMTSYTPLLKTSPHYTADAVDMEAWSVALVAKQQNIPLAVVKSIADLLPLASHAGQSLSKALQIANAYWPPLLASFFRASE